MSYKPNARLFGSLSTPGTSQLLLIQLVLGLACLWLGLTLHQLQYHGYGLLAAALLGAPGLVAATVSPAAAGRWIASLTPALGLMYLFGRMLPQTGPQEPLFVLMACGSAAVAVVLSRCQH